MNRIQAVYRVHSDANSIAARARGIAVEQSVEMPTGPIGDAYVLDEIVGRVEDVKDLGSGAYEVRIGLAADTTGFEAGQLANMLFGNTSLQSDAELVDAVFPAEFAQIFGGPNQGMAGLRARVKAKGALTATALKPQGSPPAVLAKLAQDIALGGIDYIKDDHGIADQSYSPFAERVPAVAEAVAKAAAQTGIPTRYLPSLNGNLDAMRKQIALCRKHGLDTVLATPMLAGLSQFHTLKKENPDFAFVAHPSFGGLAMAPSFLFGKLFRLLGADAAIFPNHGGRFGYTPEECRRLARFALEDWPCVKPCIPVPAGGMSLDRIPEMLDFFGRDVMLLIGGSLLSAKDKITGETARFCAAVRGP